MTSRHSLTVLNEETLSGCRCQNEEALKAEGWERRFVAEPRAAEEAKTAYEELGFSVVLMPIDVQAIRPECSGCQAVLERFRIVFTRR